MGKWEMVRLGDVLEYEQPTKYIVESTDYSDLYGTPVLTAGQSFVLGYSNETSNIYSKLPVIIFDDFTTAIKYVDFPFKVKSSAMKILKSTGKANIKYLFYYMATLKVDTELHKRYWISKYAEMIIPLPPLPVQQKIADILDRASALIEQRKAQIEKLDVLIKSQFIEMFGDTSKYKEVWLIDVIKEGAGLSYGIVQPGDDGTGELGVLRPVDILNGEIVNAGIKYIDEAIGKGFSKTLLTGDELLITVRGTTGEVALTTLFHKNMNVTRGIAVIRYNRAVIDHLFLLVQLKDSKRQRYIAEHTRGATLQQINLSDLRMLPIFLPPRHLQNEFAAFVEHVEAQKAQLKKSLVLLELHYKSLMQKCFAGDIF